MTTLGKLRDEEVIEFKRRLEAAGWTAEFIREVNRHDDMAAMMIEAVWRQHPIFTLVHGLYTSAKQQIVQVRDWNQEYGWGFDEADFKEVEASVPAWPAKETVAVVLVPYLPDHEGVDGVRRTFNELWTRARDGYFQPSDYQGKNEAAEKFRLLTGIEHWSGLRWEVIDLGSHRGEAPDQVRSVDTSPHAGVLAAAALHREWVKSLGGEDKVLVAGYQIHFDDRENTSWGYVPMLQHYAHLFIKQRKLIRQDVLALWSQAAEYHFHYQVVPSFYRK